MSTPHSYYSYLEIYDGGAGEKPHRGAFYVPKFGDTLSGISSKAYGGLTSILSGVQWINRSEWNRNAAKQGAFKYRKKSTSCTSKVVNPDNALTTQGYNDGAWLALCPPYPLFWIPETEGQMPEDLAPPDDPPAPPGYTITLPSKRGLPPTTRTKPPVAQTRPSPGPGPSSPYYQGQGTSKSRPISKAGIGGSVPGWLWLLLILGGAGVYAWSRKKKKKKRKRG